MNALVGYTGFVGSNLYVSGAFDKLYNSKNIETAYGLNPDLLVYAGVRAEKYIANKFPEMDEKGILQAEENIKRINPKKLVLISTIDVLDEPVGVNEDVEINRALLNVYGMNRYKLEQWVRVTYPDALIIRLPALFGQNIKKNFIFDFINVIPFRLNPRKYDELLGLNSELKQYYRPLENQYYQCKDLIEQEKKNLQMIFKSIGFTALNFTDSRSIFQFYPLFRLWNDIEVALQNGLQIWHAATEPLSAADIYQYMTGKEFINELDGNPACYDYRTKYAEMFGGKGEYICNRTEILNEIERFINNKQ